MGLANRLILFFTLTIHSHCMLYASHPMRHALHFTLYALRRNRYEKKGEEITISYEQTPRIYLIIGIAERCRLLYLCSIRIE